MSERPEHTVEYRSIDYYSMCEKSKAKVKAMQDAVLRPCMTLSLRLKRLRSTIWVVWAVILSL